MVMIPDVVFGRSRIKASPVALPALMLADGAQEVINRMKVIASPKDVAFFMVLTSSSARYGLSLEKFLSRTIPPTEAGGNELRRRLILAAGRVLI
jgi:hypothetical protein